MYPVCLGFAQAENRIRQLMTNDHHAEALVTAVFTFEKTLRRAVKYCVVARGFTSKQADLLVGKKGFEELTKLWPCFEPQHQPLAAFVGLKWQHVPPAVTMRNKLAHGERVFKLVDCQVAANQVLDALNDFRTQLTAHIKFDGWSRIPTRRKSKLLWHLSPLTGSPMINHPLTKLT